VRLDGKLNHDGGKSKAKANVRGASVFPGARWGERGVSGAKSRGRGMK